jgi:hypothetical protein
MAPYGEVNMVIVLLETGKMDSDMQPWCKWAPDLTEVGRVGWMRIKALIAMPVWEGFALTASYGEVNMVIALVEGMMSSDMQLWCKWEFVRTGCLYRRGAGMLRD